MEVPSSAMRHLHWPLNQVYRWIVPVWASNVSAYHWNHMSLLMSMIKPLHDVTAELCWRWHCRGDVGHGAMSLPGHADDDAIESYWWWCHRVMLVMALQLKVVPPMVRLHSPWARSIEVLSQCEEVGLTWQSLLIFMLACSRVIAGKIS
jgi:hypothetical protein